MKASTDLVVVGTGVSGMTAAKLARSAGLSTAMIENLFYGGLITNVNELVGPVHGSGTEYATKLMSEACNSGADNIEASVVAIESTDSAFVVITDAGSHPARAVIVASGAAIRHLEVPGEAEFEGKGVSRCADCDGPMFMGEEVVVVGGGDSAVQEAIALAAYAKRVHIVHRREAFRARAELVEKLGTLDNVVTHWCTQLQAIVGSETVRAVEIVKNDGQAGEIACAGVFPYVGLEPACSFVPAAVARDKGGYLVTDESMRTAVPGLLAAGIVRAGNGGTIADAEADAEMAVRSTIALLRR